MPTIELKTEIAAPIEVVFDWSRSIELHMQSTAHTREIAIAGCTAGLIGPGEEVTWEATHLGIRQQLSVKIVSFNRPHHFRDSMVRGAFQRFDHDHYFETLGNMTIMRDRFDYTAPFGPLGRLVDILFLERYMRRLLELRNHHIKATAEMQTYHDDSKQ